MPLSIDVISDVVCPWCYIGKRRLEEAIVLWRERHPGEEPEVRWHPFELNPDLPAGGMDRRSYLENKFGGPERAREIYARVEAAGREADIAFDFSRIQVQPNTSNAHRLIAWAGALGNQTPMVDALVQGYFLARPGPAFPAVPGVDAPVLVQLHPRFDWGDRWRQGIIDKPLPGIGTPYPVFVPAKKGAIIFSIRSRTVLWKMI
jgi:hypothetical protein